MKKSFYPVIMSKNIQKEADFFKKLFNFQETFVSDWYISLNDDGFELALIDMEHDTIPKDFRKECEGIILNIEVDNVDDIYSEIIKKEDISILLDIKNEDYGQRHFIIESPNRIMVDVIQMIPPSNEYIESYIGNDNERK